MINDPASEAGTGAASMAHITCQEHAAEPSLETVSELTRHLIMSGDEHVLYEVGSRTIAAQYSGLTSRAIDPKS